MNGSAPPRQAAGILLRRRGEPRSVYLVARCDDLAFFGGYWAFPGGTLDAADAQIRVRAGVDPADAPLVVAAARELFEETGILCAHGASRLDAATRAALRHDLVDGRVGFAAALAQHGLDVDGERFLPICRMTTPIFSPMRYQTLFFLVELEPDEEPSITPGELVAGELVNVGDALRRWRAGEILIVPPALILLEMLAQLPGDDPTPAFLTAARGLTESYARGKIHRVFFTPGVRKLTLVTETLPPADHTNAYLVGGDTLYLVDPGATRAEEHAKLFEALDDALAGGSRLAAVLLTHAHRDHVGAVPAVLARWNVPVWAHAETAQALDGRIPIARTLADGERIPLGTSPDGHGDWTLEVIHTPGHSRGHLSFRESRYGAILAGDMVSTVSTILVAPPDGHLSTYLASLRRLRALPRATLYPAHGPAKRDSHAVIDAYLAHRAMRERKVVAALGPEPRTIDDLLPRAYDDVGPATYALARRALAGALVKLCEDGIAAAVGERFRLVRAADAR